MAYCHHHFLLLVGSSQFSQFGTLLPGEMCPQVVVVLVVVSLLVQVHGQGKYLPESRSVNLLHASIGYLWHAQQLNYTVLQFDIRT